MSNDGLELLYRVRTTLHDGTPVPDSFQHIASQAYYANKGDTIELHNRSYVFAVGTYAIERELKYKEEYCYLPDSMWLKYNQDLRPTDYNSDSYTFKENAYYKICFKRVDGADVQHSDVEHIKSAFSITGGIRTKHPIIEGMKTYFIEETDRVIQRWRSNLTNKGLGDMFSLILLTDTHHVLNGTWADTEKNIRYVSEQIDLDGIVHLGDITDGIVSRKRTLQLADEVINGLKSCNIPVFLALGNHDSNYFFNNPEHISIEEQANIYLDREKPYYCVDSGSIRMVFLSAYDNNRKFRYGYCDAQINWIETLLHETPDEMDIMVFSHDAPLAKLDYWSDEIYNGEKMANILDAHNVQKKNIIAFMHGHTHADNLYTELSYPIVSIANNKCEDFTRYKPEGSVTQKRSFCDATQDLWDILLFDKSTKGLELVRFGAGKDRSVR
nr:metallophosphoesterase [uncultured Desulfobacter sp.]